MAKWENKTKTEYNKFYRGVKPVPQVYTPG